MNAADGTGGDSGVDTDVHGREFDKRPWGHYTVLEDATDEGFKVKRLTVLPNCRLSYQRHTKRAEHWFVVCGTATVTINDVEREVPTGGAVDVALGDLHRIENRGDVPMVFVEVQQGSYFGEDDIERIEDDYGRTR